MEARRKAATFPVMLLVWLFALVIIPAGGIITLVEGTHGLSCAQCAGATCKASFRVEWNTTAVSVALSLASAFLGSGYWALCGCAEALRLWASGGRIAVRDDGDIPEWASPQPERAASSIYLEDPPSPGRAHEFGPDNDGDDDEEPPMSIGDDFEHPPAAAASSSSAAPDERTSLLSSMRSTASGRMMGHERFSATKPR